MSRTQRRGGPPLSDLLSMHSHCTVSASLRALPARASSLLPPPQLHLLLLDPRSPRASLGSASTPTAAQPCRPTTHRPRPPQHVLVQGEESARLGGRPRPLAAPPVAASMAAGPDRVARTRWRAHGHDLWCVPSPSLLSLPLALAKLTPTSSASSHPPARLAFLPQIRSSRSSQSGQSMASSSSSARPASSSPGTSACTPRSGTSPSRAGAAFSASSVRPVLALASSRMSTQLTAAARPQTPRTRCPSSTCSASRTASLTATRPSLCGPTSRASASPSCSLPAGVM